MIILSPGPVTTSAATKSAMLRDFSPNEPELLGLTARLRKSLVEIADGGEDYTCVMLQGAGNTANEAVLGTLVPRDGKLLVVNNGHYGARLLEIARAIGVPCEALELPITGRFRRSSSTRRSPMARSAMWRPFTSTPAPAS
jgi:2-aminoethylphosphonate-pyruvate transaminase